MGFDPRPQPDEAEAQAIKELKGLIGEVPKPSVGPPLDAPASLLRFVRGYALNASDAAKAFEKMLEYRKERSIEAARAEMMAASKDGEPVWPADLPKFAPLVEISGPGLMRRIGSALGGHPATLVLLHKYEVKKIIRAGLVAMLIEFQQYQDEWWSLHLASRSEAAGKLLARADVIHAGELGIFHFDLGCARVFPQVRRVEGAAERVRSGAMAVSPSSLRPCARAQVLASAKHYPESCARTRSATRACPRSAAPRHLVSGDAFSSRARFPLQASPPRATRAPSSPCTTRSSGRLCRHILVRSCTWSARTWSRRRRSSS